MDKLNILAIETSCDESGIALIEAIGGLKQPRFKVSKNLVASQIKIHRPFGGVVPNLAKREHLKNLPILWKKTLGPRSAVPKIDLVTVTVGPGLEPALWTGVNFAKELAAKYKKPIIGANHLEGHLYSFLLPKKGTGSRASNIKKVFPAIALIVSGGHTILLEMESLAKWRKLGETRDDAAGEAFDKVARLLKLPYPGGPEIQKLAKSGNRSAINFPRPMLHDNSLTGKYDFSFSGLKTSVLYYLKNTPKPDKADIAASFEEAAVDVLVQKTIRAAKQFGAKSIMLSGGVASNKLLRKNLATQAKKFSMNFFAPEIKYNLDNAAMIGAAGYFAYLRKKKYKLEARGDLNI